MCVCVCEREREREINNFTAKLRSIIIDGYNTRTNKKGGQGVEREREGERERDGAIVGVRRVMHANVNRLGDNAYHPLMVC